MSARQAVATGGIFGSSNHKPLSNDTKDLLKVMMEESKLTNFQQRKLKEAVSQSKSLPVRVPPTSSYRQNRVEQKPLPQTTFTMRGQPMSTLRTRQAIEESGAYAREKYKAHPIKSLDKEKERLSNLMAYGEDVKPPNREEILRKHREKMERASNVRIDRFEELQTEIAERKQFLESAEQAGKGKEYRAIIHSQISQMVREMELIDRERNEQLDFAIRQQEEDQQE